MLKPVSSVLLLRVVVSIAVLNINMSKYELIFFALVVITAVLGQRPFFAGIRPIGYPEIEKPPSGGLGDRFGEVDGTTPKLPIEANGDLELIDRLSKLPIDKQPFWFINWQALEAHRNNPQTYPQKPNVFIDPVNLNQNVASSSATEPNSNSNFVNSGSTFENKFGNNNSNSPPVSASSTSKTTTVEPAISTPVTSKSTVNKSATSKLLTSRSPTSESTNSKSVSSKPSTSQSDAYSSDITGDNFEGTTKGIVAPLEVNDGEQIPTSNYQPSKKVPLTLERLVTFSFFF